LAQSSVHIATSHLFAKIQDTPAVQSLARRLEDGGALAFSGMAPPAWPFLAALFKKKFPQRPMVVIAENLKAQEIFQQDLETWLKLDEPSSPLPLLFFPEWEVFPHEGKLPHFDVISDRLQTLVALAENPANRIVVTSVTALLQKTFSRTT
jgi:transcription-repair coupling factor (superfamily II helicase)